MAFRIDKTEHTASNKNPQTLSFISVKPTVFIIKEKNVLLQVVDVAIERVTNSLNLAWIGNL